MTRVDAVKKRIDLYDHQLATLPLTVREADDLRWRKKMLQEVVNMLLQAQNKEVAA